MREQGFLQLSGLLVALLHKSFFEQIRHCEERFVRRSNPVFKHTGLLRLQKTQARNDEAELCNKASFGVIHIYIHNKQRVIA